MYFYSPINVFIFQLFSNISCHAFFSDLLASTISAAPHVLLESLPRVREVIFNY